MQARLGRPSPMAITPRHLAKRAPMPTYSASRSRSPSSPSVTVSPGWPASAFAPVSTLMPGMMPASASALANGFPALVFCRMVSSKRMAPLMLSPRPGAVTISSRQSRRALSVCGMFERGEALVAGGVALVHREQALVAGDQRLCGIDQRLCSHWVTFLAGMVRPRPDSS
jgi:hypothetical protein